MKNNHNQWACFNREYKPLGTKNSLIIKEEDFDFCQYKGLTNTIIEKLSDTSKFIEYKDGQVRKVFIYNDQTNPSNNTDKKLYSSY